MKTSSRRGLIIGLLAASVLVISITLLLLLRTQTRVPAVTSLSVPQATVALESAGLVLAEPAQVATTALGDGLIAQQSPPADHGVRRGSSVEVTVAVTPVAEQVPDVVGQDATMTAEVLAKALYLPQPVDVFGTEEPIGTVIGQIPSAGTSWLTGRPVAFSVAAGPDYGGAVKVPDVMGQSPQAALETLESAGLGANGLVRDISQPEANTVVVQLPAGGTLVRSGTTVLLLLIAQ